MLEPGQLFAQRYRVNRQIAEGGMGAIFEAEHTATERKVALKLLFPHIMSVASARQKFELEARISARVNSPYIVEVLDAGFDEATKSPYLVMELLDGQTVADYVEQRGPLGADEVLPLLEQMADALDAAHGYRETSGALKPIVHRDLKPENVFLAREHGNFMVKILDFGIAKVLGETSNVSHEVRGTPMYMAVEQITAGVLSPQTDVWALGLIAYYMLTASPYWKSAHNETANVQSLFAEILSLPIEAPSVRLRQYDSKVTLPPAFDAWLLKCIDRAPTRRFASAGVAVEELARAFRRTPRGRTRPSTRAAVKPFAATEALASPLATPEAKPLARAGTAASLPGMASEHQSLAGVPGPIALPRLSLIAAAAAGLLVLSGGAWLAFGGHGASTPGPVSAAAPVPNAAPLAGAVPPGAMSPVATPSAGAPPATAALTAAAGAVALPAVAPVGVAPGAVAPEGVVPAVSVAPVPAAPTAPEATAAARVRGAPVSEALPSPTAVSDADRLAAPKRAAARLPAPPRPVARRQEPPTTAPAPRKPLPAAPEAPSRRASASDAYKMR